jgi:hypothetical protein
MAKQAAPGRPRGRPKTRQREAFMIAIWIGVRREMWLHGLSVRKACERYFFNRADSLIKFVDGTNGELIDVINGEGGSETLRQRYQTAERCRNDPVSYPYLHARAEALLRYWAENPFHRSPEFPHQSE